MAQARAALGALVAVGALLAGCGGRATSSPSSSSPPPTASATTTAPPTTSAAQAAEAKARALLLKASEIGPTFRDAQLSAPTSTPLPCGQPDPRSVVIPTTVVVGLANDYLESVGVAENLSVFAGAADAQRVMTLLRDGYACGHGAITANGGPTTTLTLSALQDVTAGVGAQEAFTVDIGTGSSVITTIAARVDEYVAVFQIGSNGRPSANQQQLARSGVAKILRR